MASMNTFDSFYLQLIENDMWFEHACRHHEKSTVEMVASKVWGLGVSDFENFKNTPMKDHRDHVLNKLYKIPPDKKKKDWHKIALAEEEKSRSKEEPWVPLTGEAREKRRLEFLAAHLACVDNKRVAPISARERMGAENLRPMPESIKEPTHEEKVKAAENHYKIATAARVKYFREKYPNGTTKELQAYLKKFKSIDNPFNL